MIKAWRGVAASFAVIALEACTDKSEGDAAKAGPQPVEVSPAEPASDDGPRTVEARAARLAYIVAQMSPRLSDAQKTAISQDFHGAPLSGEPTIHVVAAERVSCRARTESVGDGVACSVVYSATETVEIGGAEAQDLYDALGAAGVEDESGMSHRERTISALSCTVDDALAQSIPSAGDEIAGFACRFAVDF